MITIDNLELEHRIVEMFKKPTAQELQQQQKALLNSVYGTKPLLYADTDDGVTVLTGDNTIVSRETLKMDKQDAQIMIDLARKIDIECGQVACKECIMYTDVERYQTHCLLSQLNYVRRKYSDREE